MMRSLMSLVFCVCLAGCGDHEHLPPSVRPLPQNSRDESATLSQVIRQIIADYRLAQERRPYFDKFNDHHFSLRSARLLPPEQAEISWLRRMFGDRAKPTLIYAPSDDKTGEQFRRVRELFPEAKIWGWPVSDEPLPDGVERLPSNRPIVI